MNTLKARITNIEHDENLALIELDSCFGMFLVLLIFTQSKQQWQRGQEVRLVFKQTDLLLSLSDSLLGIHNCFIHEISSIKQDCILSLVEFQSGVSALLSTRDCKRLQSMGLKVGATCSWTINPTQILLQQLD
ncbi:hypothetical protein [Helicobacter sp. 10-6591]|uniref:hypothetical protein n=1 Tax=Helicobacter sp. 10-6591 TaxID=2004998 RepID=UPI000DCED8FD|nr:hypothetical protein [Helicobacter sp. 10-6591]RAX55774.1 hypothetical protein CCY97_02435 [Helicobacter sp. 10-6591]